ncbi:MAG TPA: hypothetical protein VK001_05025 [Geminicoccaceae bacterium]|nr:hypothetical protein [Geminicoccaceae bacterium]
MLGRSAIATGLLLLAGCTHDPLVEAEVYPGLVAVEEPRGELVPVLFSAPDAPARQSLLFVAMYDAGVAAQNASLTQAAASLDEVKSRVAEVLYAIDPALAPDWWAKDTGFARVWAGSGYGMRRAARRMIEEIDAALADPTASAGLRTYGPRAVRCVENALGRTDEVVALGDQILAAGPRDDVDPLLRELQRVTLALTDGVPSPYAEGCGLEQAFLYLSQIGTEVAADQPAPTAG